jgi:hypothetical protein
MIILFSEGPFAVLRLAGSQEEGTLRQDTADGILP